MAKKKVQKRRGSREHGRGRKKGRGAGLRGGRGNAGSGGHKAIHFRKKYGDRYFGSHGFTRPQSVIDEDVVLNVGDLRGELEALEADGHVEASGDAKVIDLAAAGYDKLLGAGKVHEAYQIRVAKATDNAVAKLEAAGGTIDLVETDGEGSTESSDEVEENEEATD